MKPTTTFLIALGAGLLSVMTTYRAAVAEDTTSTSDATSAPMEAKIAKWIAELDADQYLVREEASQRLLEAGSSGLDALLIAANGDRPEPADRAVWILSRLGRSKDNRLAIAALERLVQLKARPLLVDKAESELARRVVVACQEKLGPLGAEISVREEQIVLYGNATTVAPIVHAKLTEKWRGTTDDLRCIAQLRRQLYFRLEGSAVDDAAVELFALRQDLSFLQLLDTKVTPKAVDALKERHPNAVVYARNQALLGVSAENHESGVLVQHVQPGTAAAAAGIVTGDIISSIDGQALPDFDRLTIRIAQHQPGDDIEVEILRADQRVKLTVTLGSWAGQG